MAEFLQRAGRRLRTSALLRDVVARLGAGYIRLIHLTTRWNVIGREAFDAGPGADGSGVIAAVWHGRLFMSATWARAGRTNVAFISNNRDGELISAIVARFGIGAVRGSTYDHAKRREKGGSVAFAAAQEALTDRQALVCITPDGPRGPRMRAQRGVAALAIAAQVPVQPMAFAVRRAMVAKSWDRFMVPWPLSRGVQIYGAALYPPSESNASAIDAFTADIERALNEITAQADTMCGRTPIVPERE